MLLMEDKGYMDYSKRILKEVKLTKVHSLSTIKSSKKDSQVSITKDKRTLFLQLFSSIAGNDDFTQFTNPAG